ncbi:MAG: helix-turn-helix domain-containing protein [Azospirillaceae bacterium]
MQGDTVASDLVGKGLYTAPEAARLIGVRSRTIGRWLRGYRAHGQSYAALWEPEIDIGDGRLYLGFQDLMEIRVAAALIMAGVPARHIRSAIEEARRLLGRDRPLSTNRFRTDGRQILLRVVDTDEDGKERERLLGLFSRQYEFNHVIDPILRTVDFDETGDPNAWWPNGHRGRIVVDPERSFGQPIDAESSVPVSVLASAGRAHGPKTAAEAFLVSQAAVRRAMAFDAELEARSAS